MSEQLHFRSPFPEKESFLIIPLYRPRLFKKKLITLLRGKNFDGPFQRKQIHGGSRGGKIPAIQKCILHPQFND